jgi:hypothetical protein
MLDIPFNVFIYRAEGKLSYRADKQATKYIAPPAGINGVNNGTDHFFSATGIYLLGYYEPAPVLDI